MKSSPQTQSHHQSSSRRLAGLLVVLVLTPLLAACDDAEGSGDVLDAADDAVSCGCDGECPAGECDVRVVLTEGCRGKADAMTVYIEGEDAGTASIDAPFVSCETWSCDTVLEIEVRSMGISTGTRMLRTSLDPEVELTCDNFP